jgi:hypothetical protein
MAMTIVSVTLVIVGTAAYLGLALLGWGGWTAFCSHPARVALALLAGVSLCAGGKMIHRSRMAQAPRCSPGARHHRSRGPGSTHYRACPITVSRVLGIPDMILLADNARFDLMAIAQRYAFTIVYDRGSPRPRQRTMTP